MKFPDYPRRGEAIHESFVELLNWCRANNVTSITGGRVIESPNGKTLILPRSENENSGIFPESAPCAFGTIITNSDDPPAKLILGGLIQCGDKNFAVADHEINTSADGEWLVQITLSDIECATDDDGEIFLPGVITSSGTPEWGTIVASGTANYDDNTNPDSPASPTGTIVFPVGRLKITDGDPSLAPTGCGNFTVGQCAGILNFSRA